MAGGLSIESSNPIRMGKEYPGKLTKYVIFTCVIAAMGGGIFGYDIGISGGVTSMSPFLQKFFPKVYRQEALDESTNQYCKFDSFSLTMFTSSLYLAALIASFAASWVTTRLGRKWSMFCGGINFLVGSIINAAAQNIAMLIIGRILLGIGVGFATQSVPLYVSEMAPPKHRGTLNVMFQLFITLGILAANAWNYVTPMISNHQGWRLSLGGAAIPALIMGISSLFLPNTPNSILEMGKPEKARKMLRRIRGVSDTEVEAEISDIAQAIQVAKAVQHPWRNIMSKKYRPHLTIAVLIPMFQQLTGMNVIMFYAPVLFKTIGFGDNASLMSALITGGVNLLSTLISIYGTDRWGRRPLFIAGGAIMLVFQTVIAAMIWWKFGVTGHVTELPKWYAILVVCCICIFVSAFAFSWGPLGWLVPSEIFPLEIRSAGQAITVGMNMLFTFLIAQIFLTLLCHIKFGLFLFFAFFVFIMTLFVIFFVPETKNIPIEEMSTIWETHWYWKRFLNQEHSNPQDHATVV